jgi:hypothetical protein
MTPWLLVDIVLALAALVACAFYVTRPVPAEEGNRPAAPDVLAQRATARAEAWRQLDARLKGRDR